MVIPGCYPEGMAFAKYAKRSISLPEELDDELERQAEAEGTTVSALLVAAAEHSLRVKRGLAAVAEWQRETGVVFTADEIAATDALLDDAGVGFVTASADPNTPNRPTTQIAIT